MAQGVNLYLTGTPRITFQANSHADFQNDGVEIYWNLSKIWATMGRVGPNGTMRAGFVEEGDSVTPAPQCWIEENAAGVWAGANRWDSLVGYNPLGGLAAGDYCVFACLLGFSEVVLHLDAALGVQPSFAVEYATGPAAWAAIPTVYATPDFTQANGFYIQRLRFDRPSWSRQQITGSGMPRAYFAARLYLNAPIGAGPLANQNYKDWLQGYHKHFYCRYDLKRGDTAADFTSFADSKFSLRFDEGTFNCLATILNEFRFGSRRLMGDRYGTEDPWVIFAPKGPGTLRAPDMYGGYWICHQNFDLENYFFTLLGSSGSNYGRYKDTTFAGVDRLGLTLGGGASAVLEELDSVTIRCFPSTTVSQVAITNTSISSQGRASDVRVVAHSDNYAVRTTSIGSILDDFILINDGALSFGNFFLSSSGTVILFRPTYAQGPPVAGMSTSSSSIEVWRAPGYVGDAVTKLPLQGIPFRIKDSDGVYQSDNEVTGADGFTSFINAGGYGVPPVGVKWQNCLVAVSASPAGETVLDNPFLITVNPEDSPSYNPDYETVEITSSLPRRIRYDAVAQDYVKVDYQRDDMVWQVALKPIPPAKVYVADIPVETPDVERVILSIEGEAS